MELFKKMQGYNLFGVEIINYIEAIIIFVIAFFVIKIFKKVVIVRLHKFFKKTKTTWDDAIINTINEIGWPFYVTVSLYLTTLFSAMSEVVEKWILNILLIVVVFYTIQFISRLLDFGTRKMIEEKEEAGDGGLVKITGIMIKIVLWAGAVVLILSNLGYNVTSLIAGLGIGGIAIGLALQNILGDLFSSLAIHFDKPFKLGDFIVVGDVMGTVKHIGVKTTRIAALQGEEVVISNTDITNSRVQNYGRMEMRRVVFSVGVSYETPSEKLKRIPKMITDIISSQEKLNADRVHFREFGDSSLNFETVYYIATADYNEYMDAQQNINLGIVEKFADENISIAYPTTTVHLKQEK